MEGSSLHQLLAFEAEPDEKVRRWFKAFRTVVAFAAQGDYALGENLSACGVAEVHVFLPFPPEPARQHVAEYSLASLRAADLCGPEADLGPLLPVTDAERAAGMQHLSAAGLTPGGLAMLLPGSGAASKNWPADCFAVLAAGLAADGLEPVLVSGPADAAAVQAVQEASSAPLPVLVDERPTVLKGLLAQAALAVGNDAGPCHLAGLIGTPTAAVFGPSDPHRWRPLGPRVEVVRAEGGDLSDVSVAQMAAACGRLLQT